MPIQKDEAIILKARPFRSSSLIVHYFTREFGKMTGVVKGVRKEREMQGAAYEPFTHIEVLFYEKQRSDLYLISETTILKTHEPLRKSLESMAYASYGVELVDIFCQLRDPHPEIFELLQFCFRFLPSIPSDKLMSLFGVKLLEAVGLIPSLENCLSCGEVLLKDRFFPIAQGGLFCPRHTSEAQDIKKILPETLDALRFFASHPLEDSLRKQIPGGAQKELAKLLQSFLLYHHGYPLKSWQFIKEIQS